MDLAIGCVAITVHSALACANKSVKGTRRPLTVLKFRFLFKVWGFAWFPLAVRPLPLRYL